MMYYEHSHILILLYLRGFYFTMKYYIKVKNILDKDKNITLLDGSEYLLKNKDEKIIGEYSDEAKPIIFKLLKTGFEVSKILEEHIKEHMMVDTIVTNTQTVSKNKKEKSNGINNVNEEKPKKRRGRPPKNK